MFGVDGSDLVRTEGATFKGERVSFDVKVGQKGPAADRVVKLC